MPWSWKPSKDCPSDVKALRAALLKNIKGKKGNALISKKFTNDHIFPGHVKDPAKLLAHLRTVGKSTLVSAELVTNAHKEVKNWIEKFPEGCFALNNGTWTLASTGNLVSASQAYTYVTVDKDELAALDKDDIEKKKRKWCKESKKTPRVGCSIDSDGVPTIYHLDY